MKFKKGAHVYLIGGKHQGTVATLDEIEISKDNKAHKIKLKNNKEVFETLKDHAFVVDVSAQVDAERPVFIDGITDKGVFPREGRGGMIHDGDAVLLVVGDRVARARGRPADRVGRATHDEHAKAVTQRDGAGGIGADGVALYLVVRDV